MKSKLVYAAVVFCMIFALVPAVMLASSIQAAPIPTPRTWTVDDDRAQCTAANFTTIQEAINDENVSNGDTILVYNGTYNERFEVYKSLNIHSVNGSAATIIDGGGGDYAVFIYVSNVSFGNTSQGFYITNTSDGIDIITDTSDITGVSIIGNNISACTKFGIYVDPPAPLGYSPTPTPTPGYSVYGNTVSGNEISGCPIGIEFYTEGNGDCYNNTIADNTIYNCSEYGIYLSNNGNGDMDDNTIERNNVSDCVYDGIWLNNADDGSMDSNTIRNNNVSDCDRGNDGGIHIGSAGSEDTSVSHNTIEGNTVTNSSYCGILLDSYNYGSITDSTISSNTVVNSAYYGIYLYNDGDGDMLRNNMSLNTIYTCSNGIFLYDYDNYGDISNNTIQSNNVSDCGTFIPALPHAGYGTETPSGYGIYLYNDGLGNMNGNSIHDNNVSNCYLDGIYLLAESEGTLSGNSILNNNVSYCDDEGTAAGILISSEGSGSARVANNTVAGNMVSEGDTGIELYNYEGGDMPGNIISGNTIINCSSNGIYLYSYYSDIYNCTIAGNTLYNDFESYSGEGIHLYTYTGGGIYNSTITGNTIYGFGDGMYLYDNSGRSIENIEISGNQLWNGLNEAGIGNAYGISVEYAHDISISGNDISHSSYPTDGYGVYIDGGENIAVTSNNISDNYDVGIDIEEDSYNISVSGNTISSNYHDGVYVSYSDEIHIYGNSIRYNTGDGVAIGNCGENIDIYGNDIKTNYNFESYGSGEGYGSGYWGGGIDVWMTDYVYISCNNIVGNSPYGVCAEYAGIDACYNWWGDVSGPGANGSNDVATADADINYDPWLTSELPMTLAPLVTDTAAVPGTISLYEAMVYSSEYDSPLGFSIDDPGYSLGPSCTDLILELNTSAYSSNSNDEESECTPTATVNLSALLLAMLPADFQEAYVSQWHDEYLKEDWQIWMNDLSQQEMNPETSYLENGIYYYDYTLCLDNLIFNGGNQVCGYSCYSSLEDFFYEAYNNGEAKLYEMLTGELRLGNFDIPVTITSCGDENGTVTTIPLTIADFQLPLAEGWNLRSTPITLDTNYSSTADMRGLGDGLQGCEAVLTWNASSGTWGCSDTTITPLQGYYILMNNSGQLPLIVSNEKSATPPSRQLYAGWNLAGPATSYAALNWSWYRDRGYEYATYPFPLILTQDALVTVEKTGNLIGWQVAMSVPSALLHTDEFYYKNASLDMEPYDSYFNQWPSTVINGGNWSGSDYALAPLLTPGGGYWVYMNKADSLAGDSTTPLYWEALNSAPTPTPTPTPLP